MGKKILLADDSITIQKVIELTFSDEDFEVVTVGNGRLAVEKVQEVRPDLVLCDIIMPEKDGYEVCDFIKRSPTLAHIPVLLLTGAFEPFDQERAGRVGCDGFLAKPFEPQTLIAKVKDLLSRAPAPRSAAAASPPPPPAMTQPHAFVAPPSQPSPSTQVFEQPLFDEPVFAAFEPSPAPARPVVRQFEPEFEAFEPEPMPMPFPSPPPAAAETGPAEPALKAQEPASFEPESLPADQAIPGLPTIEAMPFEPEPFEPEPKFEPVPGEAASQPVHEPESEVYFIPEEPYVAEPSLAPPSPGDEDLTPEGGTAAVDQYSVSTLDEAVAAVEEAADAASDFYRAVQVPEPELVPITAEEAASLSEPPTPPPPPTPAAASSWEPPSSPLVSWSQPTVEVPLEERARAAMRSVHEPEPVFEEVFEEEVLAAPPPAGTARQATPAEPPPTAFEQPALAPPPAGAALRPEPVFEIPEESFEEVLPAVEPAQPAAGASSLASELAVPVDMVSQIAQRVIAQISEKVIREIAWEVIPDLAEALIKKEIARLKAELQEQ